MNALNIDDPRWHYFDIGAYWPSIKPVLETDEAQQLIRMELNSFIISRAMGHGLNRPRTVEECYPNNRLILPVFVDSCDWRFEPSPDNDFGNDVDLPEWFDYACHAACHWVANIAMYIVGTLQIPGDWRIIEGDRHSTVWDGAYTCLTSTT